MGADGLPAGAVTLLLTDVEGSTRLWAQWPSAMPVALARHDAIVEGVVAACGGRVVKARGEGDSVFTVFTSACDAIRAAVDLQRALLAEPWPQGMALRVRMALHTGEPELREADYYGLDVIYCARLRALSHGGQVLVSGETAEAVTGELPEDASLLDLGRHRLRDFEGYERILQLCHPALPAAFPPLASVREGPNNLPAERSSFVGRGEELAAVSQAIGRHRLVTVLGPGGVGKTRLALRAARSVLGRFSDGAWLADLAPVTRHDSVPLMLASVLGVREQASGPLTDAIAEHLRDRETLLVLDNCEHLVTACAQLVDELLARCPALHVIVTSREPLGVYGELAHPLDTLPADAALELFTDRARLVRPALVLDERARRHIEAICRRLDGIPLAIELAAARVGTMSLADIEAGLDDRFELLRDGPRTRLPRQRGLEALIDWSHDLLDADERRVFRRLSVFAGGFDRDAAAAVAGAADGEEEGLQPAAVESILHGLVRRSLVVADPEATAPFRLLDTIRSYAAARLQEAGETAACERRHARHYVDLTERLDLQRHQEPERLTTLRAARENLRTALDHCLRDGDEEGAIKLATGLWRADGRATEALNWFTRALELSDADNAARATALSHAAWVATELGDLDRAEALALRAHAMARGLGDGPGTVLALNSLATVAIERDDVKALGELANQTLQAAEAGGDPWYVALALTTAGIAAELEVDLDRAADCHAAARDGYAACDDANGVAVSLVNLADVALAGGDPEGARDYLARADEGFRTLADVRGRLWTAWGLAVLALIGGDRADAARRLDEALELALETRSRRRLGGILLTAAVLAVRSGEHDTALRLLRAVQAARIETGAMPWSTGIPEPEAVAGEAREALAPDVAAAIDAEVPLGLDRAAALARAAVLAEVAPS